MSTRTIVSRGTVTIDVESCKGCDLCIPACPPGVLEMTTDVVNAHGYRYPILLAGCTGCAACAMVCPDFCFEVYKFDEPRITEVDEPAEADEAAESDEADEADGEVGA